MISLRRFPIFKKTGSNGASVSPGEDGISGVSQQLRSEFINLALRDAIIRHSVPRNWVRAELIPISSPAGMKWDVRLIVQERNGLLWNHATVFRATFIRRLRLLDTQWAKWVSEVSWQFPYQVGEAGAALQSTSSASCAAQIADEMALQVSGGASPSPWKGVSSMHSSSSSMAAAADPENKTPSPQEIQLEKLREMISRGDTDLEYLGTSGEIVEFQQTRPFEAQATAD